METLQQPVQEQKVSRIINILSIAIPVAVAVMLGIRQKVDLGSWTSYLPHVNGVINSVTSVLLLMGLYFIRAGFGPFITSCWCPTLCYLLWWFGSCCELCISR